MTAVSEAGGWSLLLAFARVAPAIVIPLLATGLPVPRTALGVVGLAIAAVVASGVGTDAVALSRWEWTARAVWLTREVAIGTGLGLIAAIPLAAIALAGRWSAAAAAESGRGLLAVLVALVGALVYFGIGGHRALAMALGESYRVWPPLRPAGVGAEQIVGAVASLVATALAMALPMVIATAIAGLAVGVVERIAGAGMVPELALRRMAVGLALAAGLFAIALVVAREVRGLPLALKAPWGTR